MGSGGLMTGTIPQQSWTEELEAFFQRVNPDLRGEAPFIRLDVLEYFHARQGVVCKDQEIARELRMKMDRLRTHLDYLVGAQLLRREAGDAFKFEPGPSELPVVRRFFDFYRTPRGRLRVIERILGW